MSKFCENCGAEMDENEVVCKKCNPETTVVEETVVDTPKEETTEKTSATKETDTKKLAIIGASIIAGIVIVLCLLTSLIGGKYKAPIKNYYKGLNKCDSEIYLKAFPSFLEMKKTDSDLKENRADNIKDYGDKVKYSYKVLKKQKVAKNDLKTVQEYINKKYDTKVKVSKGFKLKIRESLKGKEDYDYYTSDRYVYKIDGKWYVLNVNPETAQKYLK